MAETKSQGWHPRVQRLRERLEALIEETKAYQEEMGKTILAYTQKGGNPKVLGVLEWQVNITEELLEVLETDAVEGVARIAEQDFILASSDIDDILV